MHYKAANSDREMGGSRLGWIRVIRRGGGGTNLLFQGGSPSDSLKNKAMVTSHICTIKMFTIAHNLLICL